MHFSSNSSDWKKTKVMEIMNESMRKYIRKVEDLKKDPNYKIKQIVNQELMVANNEVDPLLIILGVSFFSFSANLLLLFMKSSYKK
jgi:hypothetical protein